MAEVRSSYLLSHPALAKLIAGAAAACCPRLIALSIPSWPRSECPAACLRCPAGVPKCGGALGSLMVEVGAPLLLSRFILAWLRFTLARLVAAAATLRFPLAPSSRVPLPLFGKLSVLSPTPALTWVGMIRDPSYFSMMRRSALPSSW